MKEMITRDPLKRLDGHHLDVFVRTEEKEEEEEVKKEEGKLEEELSCGGILMWGWLSPGLLAALY